MKRITRILTRFTPMLFVAMFAVFVVKGIWVLSAFYFVFAVFFLWLEDFVSEDE